MPCHADTYAETAPPQENPYGGATINTDNHTNRYRDHWAVIDPAYLDLIGHTVVYRDHCADLSCICHFRTLRTTPAGSQFCRACGRSVQRQYKPGPDLPVSTVY